MYLLLVDQNFVSSTDIKEMIEQSPAGTDIINCYSSDTLLKISDKLKPDLVLVDFDMVSDDLPELFSSIREKSRNTHIIALIDTGRYEQLTEAIDVGGVDDYIVKPVRIEELMARVHIAAKRSTLPQEKISSEIEEREFVAMPSDEIDEDFDEDSLDENSPDEDSIDEDNNDSFIQELQELDEELILPDSDMNTVESPDSEAEISTSIDDDDLTVNDDEDSLEPYPDQEIIENDETASDFFDLETTGEVESEQADLNDISETEVIPEVESESDNEQQPEIQELDDNFELPDDAQTPEDDDFLEEIAPFDEELDQVSEDTPAPENNDDFAIVDDESAETPPVKTTFDSLFDDDLSVKEEPSPEEDADRSSSETEHEEATSEPEDSWDIDDYEFFTEDKNEEQLFSGETDENVSGETSPSAALTAGTANMGEDYFEDLFSEKDNSDHDDSDQNEDQQDLTDKKDIAAADDDDDLDFFDEEPLEATPLSKTADRKSPFPGETADDFLFGDVDEDDFEEVPETVKRYVVDKESEKGKESQDKSSDDLLSDEDESPETTNLNIENNSNEKKGGASRFFSIFGNIIFVSLLLMMTVLSFFLIQSKISGGAPKIAGYQMYIVLSGSMSPEFDTGSLAFVRETAPEEIVVGDIVTFRSQAGSDSLTTHRVVEVMREDGLKFVTRGDANNVNDPNPVPAENIVGSVTGSIPYLGYLLNFVQTRQGLILLIFVPGVLIIVFELGKILNYLRQGEGNKKKKSKNNYPHPAEDFDL